MLEKTNRSRGEGSGPWQQFWQVSICILICTSKKPPYCTVRASASFLFKPTSCLFATNRLPYTLWTPSVHLIHLRSIRALHGRFCFFLFGPSSFSWHQFRLLCWSPSWPMEFSGTTAPLRCPRSWWLASSSPFGQSRSTGCRATGSGSFSGEYFLLRSGPSNRTYSTYVLRIGLFTRNASKYRSMHGYVPACSIEEDSHY